MRLPRRRIFCIIDHMDRRTILQFQKTILEWHKKYGRHDLPWRKTKNPYRILASEIMLQQTQVDRVIPKYKSFLKKFPNAETLAKAPMANVLKEWKGLGYNRRGMFLKRAAEKIVSDFHGTIPRSPASIELLPGVGTYTARAVAVFSFNTPEIFIETNIRRIFIHFFFKNRHSVSDSEILPLIEKTLWHKDPREWYSALMDYGASQFKSMKNPNKKSKHYTKQSRFEGSPRYARSHILDHILYKERVSLKDMLSFFKDDPHMKSYLSEEALGAILQKMAHEGLLYERDGLWRISPL